MDSAPHGNILDLENQRVHRPEKQIKDGNPYKAASNKEFASRRGSRQRQRQVDLVKAAWRGVGRTNGSGSVCG